MFDPYKRALDLEFRLQVRDAMQSFELPVAERVEASRAIAGMLYQGSDGRRTTHHVFHFSGAAGKFRAGDFSLVSAAEPEPRGLAVRNGTPVSVDRVDGSRIVLQLHRADARDPFVRGLAYVLDERPPSWHPNFQRLSWGLALGEYGLDPGDRLRTLLDGTLPVQEVDRPQAPPDDISGARAREAFELAVTRNWTAIQGPPGTGKTYLLARIVREYVRRGLRVVLCCFTHRAINNALRAMIEAGIPAESLGKVRGGDEADLPEGIVTLDKREYWKCPREGFVAAMTAYAAFEPFLTPLTIAAKSVRGGRPDREALDEASFWAELNRYNRNAVRSAKLPVPSNLADVIVLDEAGQLTIPMALCALSSAPRAVLFGDHAQLPPVNTVIEKDAAPSIFHLAAEKYPQALIRLNESHRMNDGLCAFPAQAFYEGDLNPAGGAKNRRLTLPAVAAPYDKVFVPEAASLLVQVNHQGYGQESPPEASLIADMALTVLGAGLDARTGLAVLAPHRRQNNAIRAAFQRIGQQKGVPEARLRRWTEELVIDTVDRMQGQERDVIIYSLTASDEGVLESEREFLFLPNRFNVAITRARKKLIVVGSRQFFHHLPRFLLHAEWHGEAGLRTRQVLKEANVFKQWYLAHRSQSIDLTAVAEELVTPKVPAL